MGRLSVIKRPKVYIPGLVLLVVVAVLLIVIRNMAAPAVGNIDQTPPSKAEVIDPYAKTGFFSGKYISFKYPAHYKKVPSVINGNTLETVSYHSVDASGKQINTAVYPGSLDSDSSIMYRKQHPEIYTESQTQRWLEFTKKDGTEDTFFISHDGRIASVSATAPNNNLDGDGLFVASGLKWK